MAPESQRKRKRDHERRLQEQQIAGDDKNDGNSDGKSDGSECEQSRHGKDHDEDHADNAGHPSKRLKSQHPTGYDNSQTSLAISPRKDAPSKRVVKRNVSTTTDPSGAEINSKDRWLYKKLVDRTASLDLQSIRSPADFSPSVSSSVGFDVVTSYNWLNENTIIVPGGAPAFIDPKLPLKILPDHGTFHIDMNASMCPNMPFEPMFRAIEASAPLSMFDFVDVVVNRNSLQQLFEFVKGTKRDSFRIQLHLVKNILFITRRTQQDRFVVDSSQCYDP